jgi:hypothetical protein
LFEVRLAERARKPRLVLYDPLTRFEPGSLNSSQVKYVAFEPLDVINRRSTPLADAVRSWLRDLREEGLEPRIFKPNQTALLLLAPSQDGADTSARLKPVLEDKGYNDVQEVLNTWTDAEVVSTLFSSSLLVADIAEAAVWDLYAMAHALFIPTIRLARSTAVDLHPDLPWLLRGHPYGYQADLVRWTNLEDLADAVGKRAAAMRDTRRIIDSFEMGRDFLERRRFPGRHRVFISHCLKGVDRPVVDGILDALQKRSISCWEYGRENRAGQLWKNQMKRELKDATHGVIILSDGYDSSTPCDTELSFLVKKKAILLPYFYGNRAITNPKIDRLKLHIEPLRADSLAAGNQVALEVVSRLTQASS